MDAIFINSENNTKNYNTKTSPPRRLLINLTYKVDLQRGENTYGKL